jgi:hypothetical protein
MHIWAAGNGIGVAVMIVMSLVLIQLQITIYKKVFLKNFSIIRKVGHYSVIILI